MPNMEIDPEVKKGLNEEGFESETPDSGAAILVGKKEEMPQMQEKLEKEGLIKSEGVKKGAKYVLPVV